VQFPPPPPNKDNPLILEGFFFLQLSIGFTLSHKVSHNEKAISSLYY
jgi:hypothetical protein